MNAQAVKQLALRALLTYVDSLLGLLLALHLASADVSAIKTVLVSALPAAITVVRNGLAAFGVPGVPNTLTPEAKPAAPATPSVPPPA